MTRAVCGFAFSPDRRRVVLIEKLKPTWQAGYLNGVGGKIEPGETPHQAMEREFYEEAGITIEEARWQHFVTASFGDGYEVTFFRTVACLDGVKTMTAEQIRVVVVHQLPANVLPNLVWLIPLALQGSAPLYIREEPFLEPLRRTGGGQIPDYPWAEPFLTHDGDV